MLALLGNLFSGGLLGLLTTALPLVVHYFQAKQDQAHELKMRELDIQAAAAHADQELQQTDLGGHWDEIKALIEAQSRPSGVKWIDGLSSLIRPLLTIYWAIIVVTFVKITETVALWSHTDLVVIAKTIWFGDFEQGLIGMIVAYWFGHRTMAKLKQGKA